MVAVAVALTVLSLSAARAREAPRGRRGDRLLSVYVHAGSADAAAGAARRAGLRVVHKLAALPVAVASGPVAAINAVRRDRKVTYVEPERRFRYFLDTSRAAVRATDATARPIAGGPFDGTGQTIAVVDTGVDGTHPMFDDGAKSAVVRNLKLACIDHVGVYASDPAVGDVPPRLCPDGAAQPDVADSLFVDVTAVNDSDTISAGGHGTHVASIAAGRARRTESGLAVGGIAPGASVLAISIGAYEAMLGPIAAFDWLVRHHQAPCGADVPATVCPPVSVVNASWGPAGGDPEFNPQDAIVQLQRRLVGEGVVVVFANGNGDVTGYGGDGTTNMSNTFGIDPTPGVLTVATYGDGGVGDRDGTIPGASSRGQRGRPETYPDLAAPGVSITAACRLALPVCRLDPANVVAPQTDPDYAALTGSSMSAPHVAGAVALLRQARHDLTPAQIEDILEDTAHRFPTSAALDTDPSNATTPISLDEGHGLLDVTAALERAVGAPPSTPSPRCPPGVNGASDPEGETTPLELIPALLPYDPALDIVDGRLTSTSEGIVGATLTVADLGSADPTYSIGMSVQLTFTVSGAAHRFYASRSSVNGMSATADSGPATAMFDVGADRITITAHRSAFTPALAGAADAQAVEFATRRDVVGAPMLPVALTTVTDMMRVTCPIRLDVGGSGGTMTGYDAVLSAAHPVQAWHGEPNTDSAILAPTGDVCFGISSRTCESRRIFVSDPGTLVAEIAADGIVGEFDVCIGPIEPPGAVGCARDLGRTDRVQVAVTRGLYRVTVQPIAAVNSGYDLVVSLVPMP